MSGPGPSPDIQVPIRGIDRLGFLRNFITRPNIIVDDYTYYDDPRGPRRFAAAVIRSRFDADTVQPLLPIAWWDWGPEKVTRNVRAICSGDVAGLERAH